MSDTQLKKVERNKNIRNSFKELTLLHTQFKKNKNLFLIEMYCE